MKKLIYCILLSALIFSLNSLGAFAADENEALRESMKPKYKGPVDYVKRKTTQAANETLGFVFVGVPVYAQIFEEKIVGWTKSQMGLKSAPPACGRFNSGSSFCMAKDTLNQLRANAQDDRNAWRVLRRTEGGSDQQRDGLLQEFLDLKRKAGKEIGRILSLDEFGTSDEELRGLLNDAYNRRACYLYRDARRKSPIGDLTFWLKAKADFDRYSEKVKGTPYEVTKCRTTDNTWEEPTEARWNNYKIPYYEKTLCEDVRVLRKGQSMAETQRALGDYISTAFSMQQEGISVKKQCLLLNQELKTLSKRPEARRIEISLKRMNQNLRAAEKEQSKLESASSEEERLRIETKSRKYLTRAEKAAKVYVRATRKYRGKDAPKSFDELVAAVMGLNKKEDQSVSPAISNLSDQKAQMAPPTSARESAEKRAEGPSRSLAAEPASQPLSRPYYDE